MGGQAMINSDAEVRSRAEKYFDAGYNCAQAVALSNIELFEGRTEGIIQLLAGAESKGFDKTIRETTGM